MTGFFSSTLSSAPPPFSLFVSMNSGCLALISGRVRTREAKQLLSLPLFPLRVDFPSGRLHCQGFPERRKKFFFLLREIFCFPLSLCPVANGVFFFLSHTWRKKERVLLPLIFPHQSFFFFLSSFLDASLLLSPVAVLLLSPPRFAVTPGKHNVRCLVAVHDTCTSTVLCTVLRMYVSYYNIFLFENALKILRPISSLSSDRSCLSQASENENMLCRGFKTATLHEKILPFLFPVKIVTVHHHSPIFCEEAKCTTYPRTPSLYVASSLLGVKAARGQGRETA